MILLIERTLRTDGDGNILWAEASLPKLLFAHNGRVLEDQSQIDAAFGGLRGIVALDAHITEPEDWTALRIDLAWNFDLPARPLILPHCALRVPGIRRGNGRRPPFDTARRPRYRCPGEWSHKPSKSQRSKYWFALS